MKAPTQSTLESDLCIASMGGAHINMPYHNIDDDKAFQVLITNETAMLVKFAICEMRDEIFGRRRFFVCFVSYLSTGMVYRCDICEDLRKIFDTTTFAFVLRQAHHSLPREELQITTMGCCTSSPYSKRIYDRDSADLDEDEEGFPVRTFGVFRAGSNLIPDDCGALPSAYGQEYLATNSDLILYEAEIDQGYGYRCLRLEYCCLLCPWGWLYVLSHGLSKVCVHCTCDEACCWLRKEYSTRTFFRIYPNRIAVNHPKVRWPWGYLGCGSWNADGVLNHPFDRGAFGFSTVHCGIIDYLLGCWPVYGGTVARHRCQCNGPVWNRMCTDCGGCWCDEWVCQICFCTYRYSGLANPEEVAFACSIALQAYFEGRQLDPGDMVECIKFWRENLSEEYDPVGRKRPVCCEPYLTPCCTCRLCYDCTHRPRKIPYHDDDVTPQMKQVSAEFMVGDEPTSSLYAHVLARYLRSTKHTTDWLSSRMIDTTSTKVLFVGRLCAGYLAAGACLDREVVVSVPRAARTVIARLASQRRLVRYTMSMMNSMRPLYS
jgi:hypothetical protein